MRLTLFALFVVAILMIVAVSLRAGPAIEATQQPWPAAVPGHVPVRPNEHPRLFFRKGDVAELRRRAATPEGQAIVARLRVLLNGSDGESLPAGRNPNRGPQPDGSGDFHKTAKLGEAYTLWHGAGYGLLYQVTGDAKYADLARQCVDLALEGQRDRDNRYSFGNPVGALRAGPSLGAIAMAYDLCFDAWPADYRKKIALAIQNYDGLTGNPKANEALRELCLSPRLKPTSNHWGAQVGGAGIALIAIYGDDGTDTKLLDEYLAGVRKNALRNLTEGFGDGGYFWEHLGPSQISSDTSFTPYLAAERIAMGQDFISPRPNAQWLGMRWAMDLLSVNGKPEFPLRHPSSYGTGKFFECRDGLSRGGQFVQGMLCAVNEAQRRALLWTYNHVVEPDPKSRTYDLVSPYPHRAIFALTSWPIGLDEQNPVEVLPLARRDSKHGWFVFRNRWKDADDILITALLGGRDDGATSPSVWGLGMRLDFPFSVRGASASYWNAYPDGSGVFSTKLRGGVGSFAVDFSGQSGADALIVYTGPGAGTGAGEKKGPNGASATTTVHTVGTQPFTVMTLQRGKAPEAKVDGDTLTVGAVKITFDGEKLVLSSFPK